MIYIPKEWLRDAAHEELIYTILKPLDSDLLTENELAEESVIEKLQELKEDVIVEKIRDGSIPFGA